MSFFNGKDEPENGFTVEDLKTDAAKMLAILRALTEEFMEENERPLADNDERVAARTPLAYLKKGAALCEAAPDRPELPPRARYHLDIHYAALRIFAPVFAQANELIRQMDRARVRKKVFAISMACTVHRVGRFLVDSGIAKWLETHVQQMQRLRSRQRHPKPPET